MQKQQKTWVGVAIVLLVTVFTTGMMVGKGLRSALSAEAETYEELKIFAEVLSVIQKNYVEESKSRDLVYGAIRGMLNTLDPHSAFMSPEAYKEMQVDTRGEFGGLGIQIGIKDNRLTVIAPIEGTPADRAGIHAGDFIIKVNEESTKEMTLMEAVQKMRGPKGTKVALTIQREGTEEPLVFNLIREVIKIDSVKSKMLENHIGYVRVSQFQEMTAKDLTAALKKLKEGGMQSVVLDLRNNPGGLLTSAVETTELFIPPGKTVVSIKGRDPKKEKDEYLSGNKNPYDNYPMIVLVNEGSASASEIVSGALQDWSRAMILGTQTFGKGSVQTILQLSDGSGLRLTTAKYYTPKGRSIQNIGITPDIIVKSMPVKGAAPTPFLLREKDLERHLKNEGVEPRPEKETQSPAAPPLSEASQEAEDVQLQKAIELLKTWERFKEIKPLQTVN
ncbi:MAG: S41 family peptidase [Nitrospirae bacterium]|nr:S41 family peptidase [Nitrospirota bacterium]